jgi:hypothetical protein
VENLPAEAEEVPCSGFVDGNEREVLFFLVFFPSRNLSHLSLRFNNSPTATGAMNSTRSNSTNRGRKPQCT